MDLDDFKVSNVHMDIMLVMLHSRLPQRWFYLVSGAEDMLIRYGGDEFLLILSDVQKKKL